MGNTGVNNNDHTGIITSEFLVHIYYEDTDFSGFVYHANYLKFFERAREHMLGFDFLKDNFNKGYQYVMSHIEINYLYPAKHADTLIIKSEANYTKSPVIHFKQAAYLNNEPEKKLCEATLRIVGVNSNGKPKRPSPEILEYFKKISTESKR